MARIRLLARSNVESRNVILKSCHSDAEWRRNLPPPSVYAFRGQIPSQAWPGLFASDLLADDLVLRGEGHGGRALSHRKVFL